MKIMLFFTFSTSLKKWAHWGMMDREIVLYNWLAENKFDVSFLTYGDDSEFDFQEKVNKIKIIPLYTFFKQKKMSILKYMHSLIFPFKMAKQLKEADLYKTNQMWGSWVAVIAKLLYRKKLIIRCGYEQYRFALLMNMPVLFKIFTYLNSLFSYWLADHIIISTEIGKEFIKKHFKIPDKKITVIYNYVNTDKFKPISVHKYQDRVLFVGRLEKEKNLYNLFDAIKGTSYTLDVFGQGRMKDELQDYVNKNNISVNFMGHVPNSKLVDIYNRYLVYILPSLCEGMPKTLLEAMSCGQAVIGSDIEGINNLISHGNNGYICGLETESILEAINTLMKDKEKTNKLGVAARKYITKQFSLNKIAEQEVEVYSKVLR